MNARDARPDRRWAVLCTKTDGHRIICFDCYADEQAADLVAARLAALGCRTNVRAVRVGEAIPGCSFPPRAVR
jgi:hypothetical protein